MPTCQAFRAFSESLLCAAIILFASTAMLNAQPFTKITTGQIATDVRDASGASWIDYDNDGDLDLFIASGPANGTRARDYLYRNQLKQTGAATFERINDAPLGTDLADGQVWNWIDYDNDGDLDAYLTNYIGNVAAGLRNFLYRNDGDLDLFVPNVFRPAIQAPPHFYRNDLSNNNHWVKLKPVGTSSNRDGIGAKLRAKAAINGNVYWQLREASSQNTFCGQNSPEIHFGFGDAASIDSLRIEWPLGQVDVHANVQTNTVYEAVEGAGLNPITTAVEDNAPAIPLGFALEQNYPNPFNPTTRIAFALPVASRVTLTVFDVNGRVVTELIRNQLQTAGRHEVSFSTNDLVSGIYFCKLEARSSNGSLLQFAETKTMT